MGKVMATWHKHLRTLALVRGNRDKQTPEELFSQSRQPESSGFTSGLHIHVHIQAHTQLYTVHHIHTGKLKQNKTTTTKTRTGVGAVPDSFSYLWDTFPPSGLPLRGLMWRYGPGHFVAWYAMSGWDPWEACSLLRGGRGCWIWGRGGGEAEGKQKKGKLWSGCNNGRRIKEKEGKRKKARAEQVRGQCQVENKLKLKTIKKKKKKATDQKLESQFWNLVFLSRKENKP